jgi:hypothetical protein
MLRIKTNRQKLEKEPHDKAAKARPKNSLTFCAAVAMAVALAALASPRPLSASLGGDATSVEADRVKMQATVQTTSKDLYTIQEIHTSNNTVVREFVSPAGKVFAVAWQGQSRPDLPQLLGTYFDTFHQAAEAQKAHRTQRGVLSIQQSGLVVQMGGHMRYLVGRAYVPQMVPSGVKVEEIR